MSNFENAKKYSEFARLSYIIASDTITNRLANKNYYILLSSNFNILLK